MSAVRVRFAPSPTGFMHLGNVRTALINYLFAQRHRGTFILRIEDTDAQRNFDPGARQLLQDLSWLGLTYDEGPVVGGSVGPYYQSERSALYAQYLAQLQEQQLIYRCFCSLEELEKQRQRQIAQKRPPRYERTCLRLSPEAVRDHIDKGSPFVWRLQLPDRTLSVQDIAHGPLTYDLSNFSDCTLTRPDGSFTFLFANFVDDVLMQITHVIRGEDHLTNTGNQAALYAALNITPPVFWHLPIMCNNEGKKLSKRDFGFALKDLQQAGYLPEAIVNYLAIIGGSFDSHCIALHDLIERVERMATTSQIRYDAVQLRGLNHAWIQRLSLHELLVRTQPFFEQHLPAWSQLSSARQLELLRSIQPELHDLAQAPQLLAWVIQRPLHSFVLPPEVHALVAPLLPKWQGQFTASELADLKQQAKAHGVPGNILFPALRTALTGSAEGVNLQDAVGLLEPSEAYNRLSSSCG